VPVEKQAADLPPQLRPYRLTMSKAIPKECMALLNEASEMFSETGCVPGIDGEEVAAHGENRGSSPLGSANEIKRLLQEHQFVSNNCPITVYGQA